MTRATLKYLIVLLALVVLFNWKILLTSQFTFLFGYEGVSSAYSWYTFWTKTAKQGVLPIWDPYTWSGRSFVGEMQTGAFYPLNVLLLLAPFNRDGIFPRWVYDDAFVLGHLLGTFFMFALMRELKVSRFTSLMASLCFSLAGAMNHNMSWPDMVHSAIWLPLIFLFFLRAVRQERVRSVALNAALAGLCFGMSILAGRLHMVIMQGIFIVTATIFYYAHSSGPIKKEFSLPRPWLWAAGLIIVIVGVGAGAGAVQLLPSYEYSKLSLRFTEYAALPTVQKIPYAYLPDRLYPNAWLGVLFPRGFNSLLGAGEAWVLYIGVFPFLFAILGVWKTWNSNPWTRYFTGLAVVVFFFVLGFASLLHGVFYATIPLLYMVREGPRFIYLAHFALVMLSAFGMEFFFNNISAASVWAPVKRIVQIVLLFFIGLSVIPAAFGKVATGVNEWEFFSVLMIISSCALFLYLLHKPLSTWGRVLAVTLVLFDLSGFNWTARSEIDIAKDHSDFRQRIVDCKGVVKFLKSLPGPSRVQIIADDAPNIGDIYGIPITYSFAATMLIQYEPFLANPTLLNTRYLMKPASAPDPAPLYQDAHWKVYENPKAYPHAWLVHEIVVEPSKEKIADHMRATDVDFHRLALLEAPLPGTLDPVGAKDTEQIRFNTYEPNRISMTVRSPGSALLVVSEMHYPGWRATVNGKPVEIYKVDGGLRGIMVPGGDSQIVMRYQPLSIYLGGVVTILTFLSVLGFLAYHWRTGKRWPRPAVSAQEFLQPSPPRTRSTPR